MQRDMSGERGGTRLVQATIHSRRMTSRVDLPEGLWVYWWCNEHEDLSRVRNLGIGGLYIETAKVRPTGVKTNLDFLVPEGRIRTEAAVCHAKERNGMGLKFIAVSEADRANLAALLVRLRGRSSGRDGLTEI